jgi:ribosomal protection tetracycline resistance protein
MTQYVHDALQTGLSGWRVTDCIVTMNECGYYVGDGPGKRLLSTPRTTAADFRKLTPLVLARALRQAGTIVCEPMARLSLEVPVPKMGAVLTVLARLGASVAPPSLRGEVVVVGTLIPAAQVHGLQQQLPKLTGGEGVFESDFGGYRPVRG